MSIPARIPTSPCMSHAQSMQAHFLWPQHHLQRIIHAPCHELMLRPCHTCSQCARAMQCTFHPTPMLRQLLPSWHAHGVSHAPSIMQPCHTHPFGTDMLHALHLLCSFYNPWESRTDAVVDLVYFTLAHLRRGSGPVVIPKGTSEDRCVQDGGWVP